MDKNKDDETKKLSPEDKPKNKDWEDIVILVGSFSSIILTILILVSVILTLYKVGPIYKIANKYAKACKEDLDTIARRLSPRTRSTRTSPLIPTVDTVNLSPRGWFGYLSPRGWFGY
jgi:hypothetical protein